MAEPIAEQIVQVVKTRLTTFTTKTFRSLRVGGWRPKDGTLVISQGDIIPNDLHSRPGNPPATAWDMPVIVACVLKPSDKDTTAIGTYKNRFWAEIVKAVATGDNWHNFGGLAIDTHISDIEDHLDDDGAFAGIQVVVNVLFRTSENDPFTVRA